MTGSSRQALWIKLQFKNHDVRDSNFAFAFLAETSKILAKSTQEMKSWRIPIFSKSGPVEIFPPPIEVTSTLRRVCNAQVSPLREEPRSS